MNHITKLLVLFLLASCTTGHIVTTNLHNLAKFEENSQIYTLPKTRVVVNLSVERNEFTPGPYYKYAKKYLEIEGAKSVSSFNYTIKDIQINTESITDSDYCYSIRNENYGAVEPLLIELRNKGLIIEENSSNNQVQENNKLKMDEACDYLSIKPFSFEENQIGNIKNANSQDFSNVPILKRQVLLKTEEQKAEEAANFIFKLRKRRFNLIAGKYGIIPEGVALEAAIEELNSLEEEYLSLFIGRIETTMITRNYIVIPTDSELMQRFTLLRFSDKTGFHSVDEKEGEAIVLQLTDLETNKTLTQLQRMSATQNLDMLYYRIPDWASAKIFHGSHEVLKAEIAVFQFGPLLPKYVSPIKKKLF